MVRMYFLGPGPLEWGIMDLGTPAIKRCVIVQDPYGRNIPIQGYQEGHDWQIAPDGTVTPSILVHAEPWRNIPEWHEFVKLEGWTP